MRVALLTPDFDPSYGWARYAFDLAHALIDQDISVTVLTQRGADSTPTDITSQPVLPRLVPPPRGFLLRSLASLGDVRRALTGCDIVHVVAEPYTPLAALAAGSRPLIVTAHGTYVPQTAQRRIVGRLYRRAYRWAHLIAVSDYTAAQVRAALPDANLTVIRNGVHVARFQQDVPAPAKRGPIVLASGGIKARKGTHVLIAALAQVREHVPDVQLVITGRQDDAAYLAQVRQQITDLGLSGSVHLPGQIPETDLLGWYRHADVFALPSLNVGGKFEGFGLVFLEASASGLPVIGTTGSGIEEAVVADKTGLLVPQHDVDALADAITRVLTDDPLRERLGRAGQKHARQQDWSVVAAQVRRVYEQILA
ncbi:MAG: glycosyltransferase family 4 protein [Anaerolineae bacterium]|nr:glycosyltransferase family 4 protein [Anaerolineae bacterium]